MRRMITVVVGVMLLIGAISLWGEDTEAPLPPPEVAPRHLLAGSEAAPSSQAVPQVLLDFEIYRVRGDISGETSLTEGVSAVGERRASEKEWDLTLFTRAKLNVPGAEFVADNHRWTWNGKDHPPSGGRVEQISSPRVVVIQGESFEIDIGSRQPIEYFERRPDGLFELKKLEGKPLGFYLSAVVEEGKANKLVLRDLTIRLRSIESRVPIEGVSLDVGPPVITSRESVLTLSVQPDQSYGIILSTEGYGYLLLRLWAGVVTPDRLSGSGRR